MKTLILLAFVLTSSAFGQTPKTCTEVGGKETVNLPCCPNTKLDPQSELCVDAIQDTSLVSCLKDAECGGGRGCLPLRQEDHFATAASEQDFDANDELTDILEDNDEDLELGATCTASADCESGSCVSNKCVEKRICRFADMEDEGPEIGQGVNCEPDLTKDVFGNCVASETEGYPGLLTSVNLYSDRSCNLKSDEDTRVKSLVSMKTLRSLEWLFATAGARDEDECMKLLPYVRDEIGKPFLAERKKILSDFNLAISKIEGDYRILLAASVTSDKKIVIHGQEMVEKDLASRRASGYDGMMLMYRRNLIFQAYEQAMMNLTSLIAAKIKIAATDMATWKEKSKRWSLNGKQYSSSDYLCRGGKKKKIKKRWGTQYKVKGRATENQRIARREGIASYLALIEGTSTVAASAQMNNGPVGTQFKTYYLMDSLLPSTSFDKFGKSSKKRGKRNIDGSPGASFADLWNIYRDGVLVHLKSLKTKDSAEIFEPEILALEQRTCLERLEDPTCAPTKTYVEELTDIAFAQSIAYSMHSKKNYKKYFPRPSNMRRKFFNKLETDTQNIIKYYEAMAGERTKQAACLERGLQNLSDNFLVDDGGVGTDTQQTGETGSLGNTQSEGAGTSSLSPTGIGGAASGAAPISVNSNTPVSRSDATQVNQLPSTTGGAPGPTRTSKIDSSLRSYYTPLIGSPLTQMRSTSVSDKIGNITGSASSASGSLGNLGNARVANGIRYKELLEKNQVARKAGFNVDASGSLKKALRNLGSSSASANSSHTSQDRGAAASGAGAKTAGVKLDTLNASTPSVSDIDLKRGTLMNPSGAQSQGQGSPEAAQSGMSEASLGIGSARSSSASMKEALSSSDQARIEQGYERNKGQYQGSDSDELFEKVSKAYVRNLDRILQKKKAVD